MKIMAYSWIHIWYHGVPDRNELCSALQVLRGPFVGSVAARGRRLAAVAVGELCSARSPGIVGRKKHGFRGGFGGRG
jgi:hypothetical protein